MQRFHSSLCCLQAALARQELPVTAWLHHLLHISSPYTTISSSTSRSSSDSSSDSSSTSGMTQHMAASEPDVGQHVTTWKQSKRFTFSVRPSVLSPLYTLHREAEEMEQRLDMLGKTLTAHHKLSEELSPEELESSSRSNSSTDPVAAALAARYTKMQQVAEAYDKLREACVVPCSSPGDMVGYYAVLEAQLQQRDKDAGRFKEVLDGTTNVWEYWFKTFVPDYQGLPGLGSIEAIYNIRDDDELLRESLASLRGSALKPPAQPVVDSKGRAKATGRRKTCSAQVYVWRGQGRILVNGNPLDGYFGDLLMRSHVLKPLNVVGLVDQVDVLVQVNGGGVSGQAQAAAHGIAKALKRLDPNLKAALKAARLLKRDPRMVERKKPGKAKARKGFTWVKR